MKALCLIAAVALLGWGTSTLGAQETAGNAAEGSVKWPPPGPTPGKKVFPPPIFVYGVTTPASQLEEIAQYGLSLPDEQPLWLPDDFHRTADAPRSGWRARPRQDLIARTTKPTPRLPSGKPDLNGGWHGCARGRGCISGHDGGGGSLSLDQPGSEARQYPPPDQRPEPTDEQKGIAIALGTFLRPRNLPVWKDSANLEKQRDLWHRNVFTDPGFKCLRVGVPRLSAPAYVIQTDTELAFVYGSKSDASTWRVIPIGGEFKPDAPASPYGQSIGRWEGDTLVVEVRNLSPDTWFGEYGLFHSPDMKVTERYRRVGDMLVYQAKVEDPLLAEPYYSVARYNIPVARIPPEHDQCRETATDYNRVDLFPVGYNPEGNSD